MEKMTPNSVRVPVAITTPLPRPCERIGPKHTDSTDEIHSPFRTNVPMYAMHDRSASAAFPELPESPAALTVGVKTQGSESF